MSDGSESPSPHDLLPLYHRIESAIQQQILEGDLQPGSRLPSEDALARSFGVSRLTIREALRRLASSGYVARHRGRGTFVTKELKGKRSSEKYTGFLEDYYSEVERVQVKSVRLEEVVPPRTIREALDLAEGEPVILVRRLRMVENAPFAYTLNYVRLQYGRRLREPDLYRSPLLRIFEETLGVVFGEALQTIEAKFATEEVAALLEVPFGAPVLHVERLMRDRSGAPIEVVMSYYRADRYRYTFTLVRNRQGPFRWQYQGIPESGLAAGDRPPGEPLS